MANIINNNFHNLKLKINNDEYWDFFVNKDYFPSYYSDSSVMYDKCLISYIDAEIDECVIDNLLIGKDSYVWEYANVITHTMNNLGFTGLDNGLISFRRDLHNNRSFYEKYVNSKYDINENDLVVKLHQVSGGTNLYEYPITVMDKIIKLNGGFYQGFFKTECDKYQVLPSTFESGDVWQFEFVLNKTEFEKESYKTLNDKYPENKGIFFYIGTRAENKWAYWYNKDDECFTLSPDDFVEDAEIKKNEYKITNMLDANPDFVDYDEFAMDDYMNFKYYSPETYEYDSLEEDDFFFDDYLVTDEQPKVIDEENNFSKVIGWCCTLMTESNEIPMFNCCGKRIGSYYRENVIDNISYVKTKPVCCGDHNFILNENDVVHSDAFLSKCDIFGDDYLEDIDDMEYGADFIEEDLDISNFDYETSDGLRIIYNQYFIDTDNKFLFFDRTCDGFDVTTWDNRDRIRYIGNRNSFKENLFLLLNRTCTGYNVTNIDELRNQYSTEYNVYNDLYNNALAFRITDSGAIGYRYLALDCESENNIAIIEGYSVDGIIKDNEWSVINVKIDASYNVMKLRFYVNGKLVFISKELPKLDLRKLNEVDEKQEGVAFNISLGGGTQGLIDTILPNYMLDPYRVYPLEKYFAGTFIGYLKSFKFYNCLMEHMYINNNFKHEMDKLNKINIYN